jgi:Sucrose synthase
MCMFMCTCRQSFEDRYHFSCQFTADLIAMNSADFVITSTQHASCLFPF